MHELRRYYDLFEANSLIPSLEHLFAELARIQRRVNAVFRSVGNRKKSSTLHSDQRIRALSEEYMRTLDEIHDLGVIVEDVDMGLVRFHSWFAGDEICLSWQYGEREVKHWHGVTETASERRSIAHLIEYETVPHEIH